MKTYSEEDKVKIVLKTNQWWKAKEEKEEEKARYTNVVIFYVQKVHKHNRVEIATWENNGTKQIKNLSDSPDDLSCFELCSKHEALARLL